MKTPEQIADLLRDIAASPHHTTDGALCVMTDIIRQRNQAALLEGVRIGLEAAAAVMDDHFADTKLMDHVSAIDPAAVLARHGGA